MCSLWWPGGDWEAREDPAQQSSREMVTCKQMEVGEIKERIPCKDLALLAGRRVRKGSGWRGSFPAQTAGL